MKKYKAITKKYGTLYMRKTSYGGLMLTHEARFCTPMTEDEANSLMEVLDCEGICVEYDADIDQSELDTMINSVLGVK